jgi:CLIP-associating protein 1/2
VQVAIVALDILETALSVNGGLLIPYLLEHSSALQERLGDTKDAVRKQAHDLLLKMMHVPHCSPQMVFDRLMTGFTHKQWLVRVGTMELMRDTLRMYGAPAVNVTRATPLVCKLVCL